MATSGVTMQRSELHELHYITPIVNAPSIVARGILSHRAAEKLQHESVAMAEIQTLRSAKGVPGARQLHEYVNLYITARNPMMYKLQARHAQLCVLRVSPNVLDTPDAIVSSGYSASEYTRFAPAPEGLAIVDGQRVFAQYWTSSDPIEGFRRKSAKCAEVLVPNRIDPSSIIGAYVSCEEAREALESVCSTVPVTLLPSLFFR